MKTCTVCKKTKPYEEFHKLKSAKDGRQFKCKECKNAYTRNRYKEQAANPLETPKVATCQICSQLMCIKHFRVKKNGLPYSYCLSCSREYATKQSNKGTKIYDFDSKKCTRCLRDQPLDMFKTGTRRYLESWCRDCRNEKHRENYKDNPKIQEGLKESYFKRREKNRINVFRYLLSNSCTDCGENDPVVLEFDHVRGEKRKNVSELVEKCAWKSVADEIKKCEVVCRNCHRLRTAEQMQWHYR